MTSIGGAAADFGSPYAYPWIDIEEITSSFSLTAVNSLTTTGDVTVGGGLTVGNTVASGNEGGEIDLATAPNGTLSTGTVAIDIYQDRLRIFENNGSSRGAYLDIAKLPGGVGGEIGVKASGFVNRGVDVTLGNLKARIALTDKASLQVATVAGTYSVTGSGVYSQTGGIAGITVNALSVSTTPTYLNAAAGFTAAGATDTWMIMDTANTIAWRISMIIGASFTSNMITIERLI